MFFGYAGIRGTRKADRRIPRKRIISVALTLIIALSIVSTAFGSVSFWFNTWLYGNDNNRYHTLMQESYTTNDIE